MAEPNTPQNVPPPSSSSSAKVPADMKNGRANNTNKSFSGQKIHYPNPPDASNPDPATLREQWKFAIRQYSKWAPILCPLLAAMTILLLLPKKPMKLRADHSVLRFPMPHL
ncbi:hypothetical protein L3X38_021809 [Prunus dulcis]|uniref:Uncharacterized protein n=1 Tax=Prunus dulcis TaxID=3755 RepID=A0AAD4VUY9_PRUDU|nr:hypothetical protein L3X38_021809 [Prunus dulcis]